MKLKGFTNFYPPSPVFVWTSSVTGPIRKYVDTDMHISIYSVILKVHV